MIKYELSSTILLVEDSEVDIFTFQRALKKAGVKNPVRLATDGQQAVDILAASTDPSKRAESPVPCLIFLDIKLPYRDGIQVLEWLRTQPHLHDTVVVMLTGSEEPRDKQRAYALGARSYLVKPISPAEILNVLNSLWPYWSGLVADPLEPVDKAQP